MDPNEAPHPDPVAQGAGVAGQKLAEFAAIAALLAQVVAQVRARQASQAADQVTAGEAELAAARAGWAPALDRGWLADAALRDVAGAWGAALPYEAADPAALAALAAAEARMRDIHPYAMAAYDKLRAQGYSRADAMREAVPQFLMHPRPRPAPRDAQAGRYLPGPAAGTPAPPAPDPDAAAAGHLLGIIAGLNDKAIAAGRGPLSPAMVQMALEGRTSASPELIARIVEGLRDGSVIVPAGPARPAPRTVAAAGPGAADWPGTVHDGVAATTLRRAAGGRPARAGRSRRAPAQSRAPRPHP